MRISEPELWFENANSFSFSEGLETDSGGTTTRQVSIGDFGKAAGHSGAADRARGVRQRRRRGSPIQSLWQVRYSSSLSEQLPRGVDRLHENLSQQPGRRA